MQNYLIQKCAHLSLYIEHTDYVWYNRTTQYLSNSDIPNFPMHYIDNHLRILIQKVKYI